MRAHGHFYSRFSTVVGGLGELLLMVSLGFASSVPADLPRSGSRPSGELHPTSVTGESWLTHLGRDFNETSMGKTGRLGPLDAGAAAASHRPGDTVQDRANEMVTTRGADLYRFNCRGCHGETGAGAPPEINSVINPVRATSAAAVLERVRATGMTMSAADANTLAQQSRNMLLDRIHHGGHDMPAFPHLNDAEVNSLIGYLRRLAGVRDAEREQLAVPEERVRIGEHIAKSTCHICHSAVGPNPNAQELFYGAIPPLSQLPRRVNQAQFVRKVTQGAPILMGEPAQYLRGRMPVFYYLNEEEAADVYLYLTSYPPNAYPMLDASAAVASPGPEGKPHGDDSTADTLTAMPQAVLAAPAAGGGAASQSTTQLADEQLTILAVLLGLLASMILCLGFWFTALELKRLSGEHPIETRSVTAIKSPAALPRAAPRARSAALLL